MNIQTKKAIDMFNNGGIVIFPTDTAIGIGCRIDKDKAIKRLFEIRRRPKDKSLIVLVSSVEMAQKYLLPIPEDVKLKLINRFWPGELTIILQSRIGKVPSLVRGGKNTLGVRFPNNKMLAELIEQIGVPIVAPSANFSTEATPFRFEELNPELVKLSDYVLKGDVSLKKNVSTIINCTVAPWKIIREGAVKISKSQLAIHNLVLIIDTADNKRNMVGLKIKGKKYLITQDVSLNRKQTILPMINEILRKHTVKINNVSAIEVNVGPGSYTGLRVGLAIANSLSFALNIPINGKKIGEIILPIYS
jgi:L-threonylcarbamoyladenylate synthase